MSARRRGRVAGPLAVLGALALVLAACSSDGSGGSSGEANTGEATSTLAPGASDYSGPGPYPVGTIELAIGDGQAVYLYYPADPARLDEGTAVTGYSSADAFPPGFSAIAPPQLVQQLPLDAVLDAPSADGPFPLVLYSHGFASYPEYSANRLAHLASWGFVTAAPDHTSRNLVAVALGSVAAGDDDVVDLRDTLELVRTEAAGDGVLAGAVDLEQIAAVGHSAGGAAAAEVALDDDIDTFIGHAPASPLDLSSSGELDDAALAEAYAGTAPPQKPSMLIAGERDGVIPLASVDAEFDWLAEPKRYAVLADVGHNAFTDLCEPIRAQGGLVQFAGQLPIPDTVFRLADDGCTEGFADPVGTVEVIDHLDVAQLRWVFGIDPSDASLTSEYLESRFPGAFSRYEFVGSTESGQG